MSSEAAGERGELLVVSAPSGAGKTTLIRALLARGGAHAERLAFSVSHTTRRPRPGEVEGVAYHFVTRPVFEAMAAEGRFLEWARVHDRLYGTSRDAVEAELAAGRDVLLDIDVQGARQVKERFPQAASIFVLPPSFAELRQRLMGRGQDAPEQVATRLRAALEEVRCYETYDYVILNDDPDRAADELAAIILSRRVRRQRMQQHVDRVLASFRP